MRIRAKVLTVATALVTTFAILPTLGAAAAETLQDGSYDIVVEETTYTVDVVDGVPIVDEAEEAVFAFEFDDDGRVLDEFDLTIDGLVYEVEIADDGTVKVTLDDDADEDDAVDDDFDDDFDDDQDNALDDESDEDLDGDEPVDDDLDAAASDAHGALVSTIAHCAPSGTESRDAGLPNHGAFVSAAAGGESIDFTVDGTQHSADFSTIEGAEAFCSLVDHLLTTADGADTQTEDVIVTDEPTEETEEPEEDTEEPEEGAEEPDEPDEGTDEPDEGTDEPDDAGTDQDAAAEDDGAEDDGAEDDGGAAAERSREARDASDGNG